LVDGFARVGPPGQWRDPSAYSPILQQGRAGLAWEILRRMKTYQDGPPGPAIASSDGMPTLLKAADDQALAKWGLVFRRAG
jgi:hypothetical protein